MMLGQVLSLVCLAILLQVSRSAVVSGRVDSITLDIALSDVLGRQASAGSVPTGLLSTSASATATSLSSSPQSSATSTWDSSSSLSPSSTNAFPSSSASFGTASSSSSSSAPITTSTPITVSSSASGHSSTAGSATSSTFAPTPLPSAIAPSPITVTAIEPPTLYTNRGRQNIILSGNGFSILRAAEFSVSFTNITIPAGATTVTTLSDSVVAVTVDTDAISLNGDVYRNGSLIISIRGAADTVRDVRWVDPVKSIATIVSPSKVTIGVGSPVHITGINLLPPVGQALCVFNATRISATNATYDNGTYTCLAPDMYGSGILEVNLLYYTPQRDLSSFGGRNSTDYNRPTDYVSTVVGQPLLLYYRAGPPKVIYARFTITGAIEFRYDRPVTVYDANLFAVDPKASHSTLISALNGRETFTCEKMFLNPNGGTGRLWVTQANAECYIQRMDARTFRIIIGASEAQKIIEAGLSPVVAGDSLSLKPGAVWTAGEELSETGTGSTIVEGILSPNRIVRPTVLVKAPQIIGSCSDVTFDLSRSMGSAGRNFNQSTFSVAPAVDSLQAELTAFAKAFILRNELVYTIAASKIPVGRYQFTFTLRNFLGGVGTSTFILEKFDRRDIPYVTITGPANDAPLDQLHTITAEVAATCGALRPVSFQWESQDVLISTANGTMVTMEAYSLSHQSRYSFIARAKFTDEPSPTLWTLNYTFTTELDRVMPVTITEVLAGGGTNKNASQSPLLLSTTLFDSGYPPSNVNISDFTCIWNCTRVGEPFGTPCIKEETGQGASIPAICTGADITGYLDTGRYAFTLETVRIGTGAISSTDESGAPMFVDVIDQWIPLVTVTPNMPYPSRWDLYELRAGVNPISVLNGVDKVRYSWFSNESCHGDIFSTVDVADTSKVQWQPGAPTLRFLPQTLLAAGKYCFTVFANDTARNAIGQASIVVSVREAPFAGYCSLNATDGLAYQSVFRISCAGWVTDPQSNPLFYTYWIRKVGDIPWSNLGPRSQFSVLDTVLAEGTYEVTVNVTDAAGSVGALQPVYRLTVRPRLTRRQVQPISEPAVTAFAFLNASIESYLATSDYRTAQTNLVVAIQDLSPELLNTAYHDTLLTFFGYLLNSGSIYMDAQSGGPYMLHALQSMTMDCYNLTTNITTRLLSSLNAVMTQIDETTRGAGNCVGSAATNDAMKVLDAVMGSLTHHPDEGDYRIITQLDGIMKRIESCVYRTLTCGGPVFTVDQQFVNKTVGIAQVDPSTGHLDFCGRFNLPASASPVSSGSCLKFSCAVVNSNALTSSVGTAAMAGLGSNLTSLSLYGSTPMVPLNISLPDQSINITLGVDREILARQQAQPGSSLVCAWFDYVKDGGRWSTDGCTLAALNETTLTGVCQCSHLTDFVIDLQNPGGSTPLVQPSIPTPTSTSTTSPDDMKPPIAEPQGAPTPSASSTESVLAGPPQDQVSSNSGKIAGAVVGSTAAVALLAGLLFWYRRNHNHKWWTFQGLPRAIPPPQQPLPTSLPRQPLPMAVPGPPRAYGFREARREELPEYVFPPTWQEHLENVGQAGGSTERLHTGG
ncbi:uncharacterized protein SPPG_05701 [Spizellomyces punctatus DAOM BR117]|uniref:GAIN-B domain-containing protein n=1 Tax=Spizellomyces punctatus (strain DAOM BR117) TaxID=645134 RepID=A0A0L0HD94_SPIPD|nr:uncharacterized protein SPPG_05701 [Spizellomyces punctatus DAOM BR117]KNC99465.1 hypothetical protein SPPG_05701 [Spizellomyces punctatus DAOM BR117]|eukprot:XP_016607505.1 hypothetical protein SPPG_05701 [Spizellomyces punctatus DAOM BR117]